MPKKPYVTLQPTEQAILSAAATIYAARIAAGSVSKLSGENWRKESIKDAIYLAQTIDETIQADSELD